MAIESFVQYGVVVTPGEIQRNLPEIPAEIDLWNVIVAFKHPFRLLFGYLGNTLNAFIEDIELGSLLITVRCRSLQILGELWEDYVSGHLNQVVQETLVTNEVLENLGQLYLYLVLVFYLFSNLSHVNKLHTNLKDK